MLLFFLTVRRTTKTLIVLTSGERFSKLSGGTVGDEWVQSSIMPATKDAILHTREAIHKYNLCHKLNMVQWEELTIEQLTRIKNIAIE